MAPGDVAGWGRDAHYLTLEAALQSLPAEAAAPYRAALGSLKRYVSEPDRHARVPSEGCRHWIDVEKLDPAYLEVLDARLRSAYGGRDFPDEDAKSLGYAVDDRFFPGRPFPPAPSSLAALWKLIPATLDEFRSRYGRREIFIGSVVYQPVLYTRALARALADGEERAAHAAAGYLVHFVGDLHVPFHASANYKGQYSGNLIFPDRKEGRGDVHARFETAFVNHRMGALRRAVLGSIRPAKALPLDHVTPRVIESAREAYGMIDALLEADRSATAVAHPGKAWDRYLARVAPAFEPAAARQMTAAAQMIGDLLLSARPAKK